MLLLPSILFFLFLSFSLKVRSLFSSALFPSVPLGRNRAADRSKMNSTVTDRRAQTDDRYNAETNYLSYAGWKKHVRVCMPIFIKKLCQSYLDPL